MSLTKDLLSTSVHLYPREKTAFRVQMAVMNVKYNAMWKRWETFLIRYAYPTHWYSQKFLPTSVFRPRRSRERYT